MDPRRANLSQESVATNVERLKNYHARLILFPRRSGNPKKGDTSDSKELEAASKGEGIAKKHHHALPVLNVAREESVTEVKKSEMGEGTKNAYRTLREARSEARLVGVREKRAKAKAEDSAATKK